MLAILTSVVSDNMMSSSRRGDQLEAAAQLKKQRELSRDQMAGIFLQIDQDNTGTIDEDEMSNLLEDADLRAELCSSSGLAMADLVELLHCVSYTDRDGKKMLLYRQFISMLQDESEIARERSIFKLMERMRAFEFRQEMKLNKALQVLGLSDEEARKLPSLTQELETLRQLEESPAATLAKQLTKTSLPDSPARRSVQSMDPATPRAIKSP